MIHTTRMHIEGGHTANYERFAIKGSAAECWRWTGPHNADGYSQSQARVGARITHTSGHRIGYLLLHGSIAEGLVLDHLCRNRGCVNPHHLEAVTNQENTIRQRRSGMCRAGLHEMVGHNVMWDKTGYYRRCRECQYATTRKASREWKARRKAAQSMT